MSICDGSSLVTLKKSLHELFVLKWKSDLLAQPKLRTYRQFKTKFGTENYIKINLTRTSRSFLAQFRTGVLPLHIETGRFVGKKPEERTCFLCKTEPETEEHFLLKCPSYLSLRLMWLQKVTSTHDMYQSYELGDKLQMVLSDKRLINCTANFIRNAFMLRTHMLYIE